jgi:AcrR family transcriptional regulator
MTATPRSSRPLPDAAGDLGARDRILQAAFVLFQESGYEGTSVIRIAGVAGMTPAAIYWHFASKQDVLAAMLTQMYERSYAELKGSVRSEGSAIERLDDYIHAYIRIQLEGLGERRNHSYSALASSLSEEGQHELGRVSRPYIGLLRDILRQGVGSGEFEVGDVHATSYAIAAMCEYVFTWFRRGGRLSIQEAGDMHLELVLRMVRAEQPR